MPTSSTHKQIWRAPPLRAVRVAKGMSLRAAAVAARIDPGHLSKVERGQKRLTVEALHRLAVVLELSELQRLLRPYLKDRTDG